MAKEFNVKEIANIMYGYARDIDWEERMHMSSYLSFRGTPSVRINSEMSEKEFNKYVALCSKEEQEIIQQGGTVEISRVDCIGRIGEKMNNVLVDLEPEQKHQVLKEMQHRIEQKEKEVEDIKNEAEALEKPKNPTVEALNQYIKNKERYGDFVEGAEKDAFDIEKLYEIAITRSSVLGDVAGKENSEMGDQ